MDDNKKDFSEIASMLDNIMSNTELEDVSADGAGFEQLPDGYYLSEVESTEITSSKSSGMPMIKFMFNIVEDGKKEEIDERGNFTFAPIPKSKGRKIFKYYVIKDESKLKSFVSDMLKFEGEELGVPLLSKEYFMTTEVLEQALDVLVGQRIWTNLTTKEKNGEKSTWTSLIKWTAAIDLELDKEDSPF